MRKLITILPLTVLLFGGLLRLRADTCNGAASNLVSNCGFESGSFSSWTGTATTASANYTGVDTGDPFTTYPTPYSGQYEAYLGNPGSTVTLTQTLSGVAGSDSYRVQFALLNDTSSSPRYTNSFTALFGGNTLFSESAVSAGGYTLYSFTGTSGLDSIPLSFVTRNDGGYFELDSVSVTAITPEPSSWILLGTGILGVVGMARRRLSVERLPE